MKSQDRIAAIVGLGFTERQARFLVFVMQYSGVCLLRQYSAFAGIVHGQKTRKFFAKLVSRRFATAYACRHNRGRIYHVHHKAECFMASSAAHQCAWVRRNARRAGGHKTVWTKPQPDARLW